MRENLKESALRIIVSINRRIGFDKRERENQYKKVKGLLKEFKILNLWNSGYEKNNCEESPEGGAWCAGETG